MGAGTEHGEDVDTSAATAPVPVVELRHEAGLTAGQTLPLRPGRFRFGPLRSSHGGLVTGTPEVVSFDLAIDTEGETTLTAGRESVAVEGVIIDRPVALDDGDVVQLTTDHFVLKTASSTPRASRPLRSIEARYVAPVEPARLTNWLVLFGAATLLGVILMLINWRLIGLALLGLAGLIATLLIRSRINTRAESARAVAVDNARSMLFTEIVETRKAAAEALRSGTETPAAVAQRVSRNEIASRPRLLATIASGDRAWEPPVIVHRSPGWPYRAVVDELSFLPAIPFTVDLDQGPIAIVGPRSATLAVARHLVTTAMCLGGPSSGASIVTRVPADWRWLIDQPSHAIRVLDHETGPIGPRTVVLAESVEALHDLADSPAVFVHTMTIDESGRATITGADGQGGSGFVPHGITDQHARDIQELLPTVDAMADASDPRASPTPDGFAELLPEDVDLEVTTVAPLMAPVVDQSNVLDLAVFDTDRLLVTGPDQTKNKGVLATAALRRASLHPDRSLYILDRGDRALIRLAQLETCVRYATIDQIEQVEAIVDELDALTNEPAEQRCLLLAPDLWNTVSFYRASGQRQLADRIDEVVARMEMVPLAASGPNTKASPTASFLVWIETGSNDTADVHRNNDNGVIDLRSLPGIDLTGSVARLTTLPKQEIQS